MNQSVLWDLSYGVYIIGSLDGGRPTGCVANSAMQITSSPATLAVSINHDNFTHDCIEKTGRFTLSVCSEQTAPLTIGTFGFHSGRDTDKFASVPYEMHEGLPVVADQTCGYLICKVVNKMESATHTVFLGEIVGAEKLPCDAKPMTYAYYHSVIKGRAPKNAPTYIDEKALAKADTKKEADEAKPEAPVPAASEVDSVPNPLKKWRCTVCGYVYEGAELPAGFRCPVCGKDASFFEAVE